MYKKELKKKKKNSAHRIVLKTNLLNTLKWIPAYSKHNILASIMKKKKKKNRSGRRRRRKVRKKGEKEEKKKRKEEELLVELLVKERNSQNPSNPSSREFIV